MDTTILFLYFSSLMILFLFGSHGFIMIYYYLKYRDKKRSTPQLLRSIANAPAVTIQLPVYNELYVVKRLLQAAGRI
jgi:cellulose synthase/poly-beta-1,6-N-acetylglucosamine synthase-like glycosyltransferase